MFLNDGQGHFTPGATVGAGTASSRAATLADLDGDGAVDVVMLNRGATNTIHWNEGGGQLSAGDPFGAPRAGSLQAVAVDMDGDGDLDLVLANRDREPNTLHLNDGRRGFSKSVPFGTGSDTTRAVAVADFDGDGTLDIATGNVAEVNRIFLGTGGLAFRPGPEFGPRRIRPTRSPRRTSTRTGTSTWWSAIGAVKTRSTSTTVRADCTRSASVRWPTPTGSRWSISTVTATPRS